MTGISIRLFGPLTVSSGRRRVEIGRRQVRCVLAMLALQPNHAVAVDILIDGLWGDEPPLDATHAVQVYVSRLRGAHETLAAAVRTRPDGYELAVPDEHVDVVLFDRLVSKARKSTSPEAERLARSALELWTGQALHGFQYEEFARPTINRLERRRAEAITIGAGAARSLDRLDDWVPLIEDELDRNPLDDRLWTLAIECYERLGDPLRAQDARWRRARWSEERRRDESSSETVADPVAALPGLIGRDDDLATVTELIGEHTLVTIVGEAGVGKTRLARHVAADWDGESFFIDLTTHPTPEEAIAVGLGIPALPGSPSLASLAEYGLRSGALVVLDNCEHVLEAAARFVELAASRAKGTRFLATSRGPLLTPSEHVHRLHGLRTRTRGLEQLSPAGQLLSARIGPSSPAPPLLDDIADKLDGNPLAIQITAAHMSGLRVEQMLARLDDPTWLSRARIRGGSPRHESLTGAVGWSLRHLDDATRLAFRRLGRFRGPFGEEDAAALLPELTRPMAIRCLDELTSRSLLAVTDGTYRMSWVVAAISRDLEASEVPRDRTLHMRHIADLVRGVAPDTYRSGALGAHRRLTRLGPDIDEALETGAELDHALAVDMVGGLAWHWHTVGNWPDRLARLGSIARAIEQVEPGLRLRALLTKMILEFDLRELERAAATAARIVGEARHTDHHYEAAIAEAMTAAVHSTMTDREDGLAAALRAQDSALRSGDRFSLCVALFSEASIHLNTDTHPMAVRIVDRIIEMPDVEPSIWSASALVLSSESRRRGDLERARRLIERAVSIQDQLNEPVFQPLTRLEWAMVLRASGQPLAAGRTVAPAVERTVRSGDRMAAIPCLDGLALAADAVGAKEVSLQILAAADRRRRETAWQQNPWDLPEARDLARRLASELDADAHRTADLSGRLLTDGELVALCRSMFPGRDPAG